MAMDAPNEIALRGLERDAEAVMDVDPAVAHSVFGGVASLRWNAEGVREHFRIALQHADNPVTHHNYSIALALVDEWRDSFDAADTAHKKAPDNTVILGNTIELAVESGQFRMAQKYCNQLNALRPGEAPHALTGLLEKFVASLDAGAFGESNVQRVLAIASSAPKVCMAPESLPSWTRTSRTHSCFGDSSPPLRRWRRPSTQRSPTRSSLTTISWRIPVSCSFLF